MEGNIFFPCLSSGRHILLGLKIRKGIRKNFSINRGSMNGIVSAGMTALCEHRIEIQMEIIPDQ